MSTGFAATNMSTRGAAWPGSHLRASVSFQFLFLIWGPLLIYRGGGAPLVPLMLLPRRITRLKGRCLILLASNFSDALTVVSTELLFLIAWKCLRAVESIILSLPRDLPVLVRHNRYYSVVKGAVLIWLIIWGY